jgi:hypothetical protein
MTAGKYPEDQQDPELISFLAKFGIPAEQVPFGISAGEYLAEVFRLLKPRVLLPVTLHRPAQPQQRPDAQPSGSSLQVKRQ